MKEFRKSVRLTDLNNLKEISLLENPKKKKSIDREYLAAYCRIALNYQCFPNNFNYDSIKKKIESSKLISSG